MRSHVPALTPAAAGPRAVMPLGGPLDSVRLRREPPTRDAVNARLFGHAAAAGDMPPPGTARLPYMDMAPIASRSETKQFRAVPELLPSGPASERPDTAPRTPQPLPLPSLAVRGNNPYLARMDVAGEAARNVARELRAAVVEDPREWDVDAARRLSERQFSHRWLDDGSAARIASLSAIETMRPQPDDYRTNYRPGGGGQTGGSPN